MQKPANIQPPVSMQRQCARCKQTKPLTAEFWSKSNLGYWFIYCKNCFNSAKNKNGCGCIK